MRVITIDNGNERHTKGIVIGKKLITFNHYTHELIKTKSRIPYIVSKQNKKSIFKYCTCCHAWRYISAFNKNIKSADGFNVKCR
jgi:hypothetical protein